VQLPVWVGAREVVVEGRGGGVTVEGYAARAMAGRVVEGDGVWVGTVEKEARWVVGQESRLVEQEGVWWEGEGGTWSWVMDQGGQACRGWQEGICLSVEGLRCWWGV